MRSRSSARLQAALKCPPGDPISFATDLIRRRGGKVTVFFLKSRSGAREPYLLKDAQPFRDFRKSMRLPGEASATMIPAMIRSTLFVILAGLSVGASAQNAQLKAEVES